MTDKPQDYAIPVHRSLLKRDLILGVSKTTLVILFCATVIVVLGFNFYWFLIVTGIALSVVRLMTKKDEYYVEILLNTVNEPDELYP